MRPRFTSIVLVLATTLIYLCNYKWEDNKCIFIFGWTPHFQGMCQVSVRKKWDLLTLTLVALFSKNTPMNRDRDTFRLQSTLMCAGSADLSSLSNLSPNELLAVKTEGGLAKERWHELVPVDLVDPAFYSPLPLPCKLLVGLFFHRGLIWQLGQTKFRTETSAAVRNLYSN